MLFDIDGARPETPRVATVLPRWASVSISIGGHAVLALAVLLAIRFGPTTTTAKVLLPETPRDTVRYVDMRPTVDRVRPPRPMAEASDIDRRAETRVRPPDAELPTPYSRGNTPDKVVGAPSEPPANPMPPGSAADPTSAPPNATKPLASKVLPSLPTTSPSTPARPGLGAALRDIQRNWAMYAPVHHRRAALIQERLPHVSARPIVFPAAAPAAPLGSWTLLAPDRMLVAARCSSPFPNGEVQLVEDKAGPPNRAYLKLWEALVRLRRWPQPGERCLDLGASPGGWTWVLTRHHLRVTSVDNGPLRQHVLDTGLVEHLRADGFHWHPARPLDWMVCDMVEQPSKVAARMAQWFREGWCRHAVFNLKLPMKKRWQETRLCLDLFAAQAGKPLTVRARQLYHDREEITVFATPAA